jgi:tetratricopeptide (TPR) repeat protein
MKSNVNQVDEDDENETVKKPEETDPYFIDEESLQTQQDKLTDEEKEKYLAESQNLKQSGNDEFKNENYQQALELYTQALRVCPLKYQKERSVFYSNRSACYFKLKQNEKCVKECSKSIELDPSFVKPLLRRAECNQIIDKLDEALDDYKKLSELEPRNMSHTHKCYELEQKIKERNEKLKDEMFGKLKELGNLVLKPFGLSTNNFQFVQDPNTGSYSVNFNK